MTSFKISIEKIKKYLVTVEIIVKENKVGILRVGNVNYISLTDLAKYQNSSDPSFTVKNWLRKISTIDYIGLWEEIRNQDFNFVEFDQIKTEYGRKSFAMSPTQWVKKTKVIGIVSNGERLVRLNHLARSQMEVLKDNKNIKDLELLQKQVNEENNLITN